VLLFRSLIFLVVAFGLFYLVLPYHKLDLVVFIFILFSINSSTSFFRMNSSGWKSLSILSTMASSSRLTNLLNSVRSELEILFSLSRSCLIWVFSCLSTFSSSSFCWREAMRFLPNRRTLSLMSLFRSSVSLSLVLKSDRRNLIWLSCGCESTIFRYSLRSL